MVIGHYKRTFAEASHVLFSGNVNSPAFSRVAIQRIERLDGSRVQLSESGEVVIEHDTHGELAHITYRGLFGLVTTIGRPFKDEATPLPLSI